MFKNTSLALLAILLICSPLPVMAGNSVSFPMTITMPQIISTQGVNTPEDEQALTTARNGIVPAKFTPDIIVENIIYINNEPVLLKTFVNR